MRATSGWNVVDEVVALLSGGAAGLVTDVDGTIAPIVADPSAARVLPMAQRYYLF